MANKDIEWCLKSLVIREMPNKTKNEIPLHTH